MFKHGAASQLLQVKPKDLTAAVFLLGGVTFVMSLFYLVPLGLQKDEDARSHPRNWSWNKRSL